MFLYASKCFSCQCRTLLKKVTCMCVWFIISFLNIWLLMQYFLKDETLFKAVLWKGNFFTLTPEIVCVKCLLKSTWRRVYTWYGWLTVIFPTEKLNNHEKEKKKKVSKMCCYACTCMEWNSRNVGNVILCGIKIKIFISGQQCQWICYRSFIIIIIKCIKGHKFISGYTEYP